MCYNVNMTESTRENIRVRMAPSPTGYYHIGGVRTALYNYLFAKQHKGEFLLRIEDTDKERSKKEFEDDILETFRWFGLTPDDVFRQSDRVGIHTLFVKKMLDEGKAFWCYHTKKELEAEQKGQMEKKEPPRHVCDYKKDKSQREDERGIIRLDVDTDSDRKIIINDLVRGEVSFDAKLLGDFAIAKSVDEPLFHTAVVIDDAEMKISHIIRAEEHLSNTPKHILLQEAMGFERPEYAHISLVLAPDKSKLSKRHGDTAVKDYRAKGYLPEAILNFMLFLGFTPPEGKEVLSLDEMIEVFDLGKVHKSGAVFDIQKLDWMNGEYIKRMSNPELAKAVIEYVPDCEAKYLEQVVSLARERMKKLSDMTEFMYFFNAPTIDPAMATWKKATLEESKNALIKVGNTFVNCVFEDDALRSALDTLGEEAGDRGLIYWPFRVALTGAKFSPDPVDVALVLGKEETQRRVEAAVEAMK